MYNIYIGSNNKTKRLELGKIKSITGLYFDGFTLIPCTGYYKGNQESSVIVQIQTTKRTLINSLINNLKIQLKQESIGLQQTNQLIFK